MDSIRVPGFMEGWVGGERGEGGRVENADTVSKLLGSHQCLRFLHNPMRPIFLSQECAIGVSACAVKTHMLMQYIWAFMIQLTQKYAVKQQCRQSCWKQMLLHQ